MSTIIRMFIVTMVITIITMVIAMQTISKKILLIIKTQQKDLIEIIKKIPIQTLNLIIVAKQINNKLKIIPIKTIDLLLKLPIINNPTTISNLNPLNIKINTVIITGISPIKNKSDNMIHQHLLCADRDVVENSIPIASLNIKKCAKKFSKIKDLNLMCNNKD